SLSQVGTEQTPPPRKTYLTVPPAPPPSPAEDPTPKGLSKIWEAGTLVNSDLSSWKARVSRFH
uniref:Uncharacterized protein n=1 Tax=Urocitellus parryii TaxID=9999 RepID=A0A8D2KNI1_UROPR